MKRKRGLGEEPVAERRGYELHEKKRMAYGREDWQKSRRREESSFFLLI